MAKKIQWDTDLPECDLCLYILNKPGVPAKYDGPTFDGPWANMCDMHFKHDCSSSTLAFERITAVAEGS